MSQSSDVNTLHQALATLSSKWCAAQQGEHFDNGYSESEMAASQLDVFLENHKSDQDLSGQLLDLMEVFNLPGTQTGSWQRQKWLSDQGPRWGAQELLLVLATAGLGPQVKSCKALLAQRTQEFESRAVSQLRSTDQRLRADITAWLEDPASNLPGVITDRVRVELDKPVSGLFPTPLARRMRTVMNDLKAHGYARQLTQMREILENFGNTNSVLYGHVPSLESADPQRRYRPSRQ